MSFFLSLFFFFLQESRIILMRVSSVSSGNILPKDLIRHSA